MKKLLYGALGLIIVGLLGIIISINTSGVEAFTFSSVDVQETKDVSADEAHNILIDSPTVDVHIEPTSGNKIEADFSGQVGKKSKDLYTLDIEKDGNTVTISMEKKNKLQFMMFNFTKVSLHVKVPKKLYESIEIQTASGDIAFQAIEAKQLSIETKSGDIEGSGAVAENLLLLTTASGDITTHELRSNQMKVETSSGDITASNSEATNLDFTSSSGDITSDNQALGNTTMETASGDLHIRTAEMKENVSLETSSGDIDVRLTKAPASLTADFKSNSGDSVVNIAGMSFSEKSKNRVIGQVGDGSVKLMVRTASGDFKVQD